MNWCKLAGSVVFLSVVLSSALADPRLPAIIGDGMVLQQQKEVSIWGWSDPGEMITVRFDPQVLTTKADRDGRWEVVLSALDPGGPREMIIEGNSTIVLKDILVGEVWICSGQSNMQFPLGATRTAELEVPRADYPHIRLFTVPRSSALEPQEDTSAQWKDCTPDVAKDFSAVGYLFGRKLHEELDIPVGLIDSSWGGTQAEEWTDLNALERVPDFEPILERWKQTPPEIKQLFREPRQVELWIDDVQLLVEGPSGVLADFDHLRLETVHGGILSDEWVEPENAYTTRLESPGYGGSTAAAVISGAIGINHWPMFRLDFKPEGSPYNLSECKGLSFQIRGDGMFKLHFLQPSITDWDNYATTTIEATPDWSKAEVLFHNLKQAGWGKKMSFTPDKLTGVVIELRPALQAITRPPAGLYNGMITPIAPYTIRGAIWYQGEGNAGRAHQYRQLLPTLIRSWRHRWNQGTFPFLIVQLPNFRQRKPLPSESNWAELREAQFLSLSLPQTGLAVAIDAGESDDVHPKNKTQIAERLAAWALGTTYDRNQVYSGPLFESVTFHKNSATLTFTHSGGGLVAENGGPLEGFALAGPDRKFHWAEAQIIGDKVVVHSETISDPVALRYAWADNPKCNLFNKEGFPAAPFRTDQWPGVTVDKK